MSGWMWLLATVIGVAILGGVIFFGQLQSKIFRRDRRAVERQREATKRLYEKE
jgi:hypothetical protein